LSAKCEGCSDLIQALECTSVVLGEILAHRLGMTPGFRVILELRRDAIERTLNDWALLYGPGVDTPTGVFQPKGDPE